MAKKEGFDYREEWGTEMLLSDEQKARRVLNKMNDVYAEASQAIQDDINRILGNVISRNALDMTPAELRKQLSKAEVRTWKKTVGQYMAEIEALGGRDTVKGQALWMELEYLSALTRVTRLEALQMSIDANMARVAALSEAAVTEHLQDVFRDDYYANMYRYYLMDVPAVNALMASSGIAMTNSYVHSVVMEHWKGLNPYSARLWRNEYNGAFRMLDVLSQVLVSGRSPSAVASEISKRIKVDKDNLWRLILTETCHVKTAADVKSYKDAGFDAVEFCATLDMKTCHDCQNLDGKVIKMSALSETTNMPPMHANCRCCLLPVTEYMKEVESKITFTKFSRDKDGTSAWVDGKMNYKEWRASLRKKKPR